MSTCHAGDKTLQVNVTAPLVWAQQGVEGVDVRTRRRDRQHRLGRRPANEPDSRCVRHEQGLRSSTRAASWRPSSPPDVRVNTILPGLIRTDFARVLWEGERGAEVADSYPLKRLGEPADIANAALYLASEASSWMTGQELVLDGGGTVGFAEG